MGKNKKERKDGEEKSPHSAATVCVSGLPYSITNTQLEEAFSEVGPVRRCFLVTNKGSNEHRVFAFVILTDLLLGGRRITVKQATHRPSLQERRTKAAEGISLPNNSQAQSDKGTLIPETDKKVPPQEKKVEKPIERKKVEKSIERKRPTKLHVDLPDKETCSDKQRACTNLGRAGF